MDGHKIWEKMQKLEGEEFLTVTGKMFTYKISGNKFKTSRTNMWISKNDLMKAVAMMPIKSVSEISGVVIGPSYIYAILNDKRINCDMDQNSVKTMSMPPLKKSDSIEKPSSSIDQVKGMELGDLIFKQMEGHIIWKKMQKLEGEEFLTVTGKMFTYKISGNKFKTSRTNMWISKNDLMKAVSMMPIKSVSEISGVVIGPSYIYAILNDKRINRDMDQNSAKIISKPILKKSDGIIKPLSLIGQVKGIELGGLIFKQTPIRFKKFDIKDTFSGFNKYTLEEMISRERYSGLANETKNHYQRHLSQRTGEFLLQLKEENDPFYKRFLNRFGDNSFCHFELTDVAVFEKRGLYAYYLNDKICYIGRCRDNFYSRFNLNYGKIHPINCYREGQSTNCHINALLNRHREQISIYLCPIQSLQEIEETELELIRKYNPDWNIQK